MSGTPETMKLTDVVRVEGNEEVLDNLSKITNGLWNMSVYVNEKELERTGKYLFYQKTYHQLKGERLYGLLPSQTSQAILQKHEGALRSYLRLKKTNPKARRPGFRRKNSCFVIPWKSAQFKIFGEICNLTLSKEYKKDKGVDALVVRLVGLELKGIPKYMEIYKDRKGWFASVVQEVAVPEAKEPERFLSLDIGIRNLAAVYDETDGSCTLYKGGAINAIARYREKEKQHFQEVLATQGLKTSRAKTELGRRLTGQIHHAVHAFTNNIVQRAKEEGVGVLAGDLTNIRKAKRGKKKWKGSKQSNQLLHSWIFGMILLQLEYKCKMNGVYFEKINERNTSKRCCLCRRIHPGGRKKRGLYRCKLYSLAYNADCGGAFNILQHKKYRQVSDHDIGVVGSLANPVVVQWNKQHWTRRTSGEAHDFSHGRTSLLRAPPR